VANPVLIAAPLAILPTAIALWYLLRRYEAYFDDARVFLSLTFGFFAGLLAVVFESFVFPFQDVVFRNQVGSGTAFLLFVIGYPLFESGLKSVILGMRRYRGRKDTPYYGAALGLGMGAMMALGFIAANLNLGDAYAVIRQDLVANGTANVTLAGPLAGGYHWGPLLAMVAVPIGAVFAHGATAVYVGRYISKGSLWKAWIIGALLQIPSAMALALFWPSIGIGDEMNAIPGVLSIVYGVGLLAIARARVLDVIVPKDVLDRLQKAQRREARAVALGNAPPSATPDEPAAEPKLTVIPAESAAMPDADVPKDSEAGDSASIVDADAADDHGDADVDADGSEGASLDDSSAASDAEPDPEKRDSN
jgi:hypothetical protein